LSSVPDGGWVLFQHMGLARSERRSPSPLAVAGRVYPVLFPHIYTHILTERQRSISKWRYNEILRFAQNDRVGGTVPLISE